MALTSARWEMEKQVRCASPPIEILLPLKFVRKATSVAHRWYGLANRMSMNGLDRDVKSRSATPGDGLNFGIMGPLTWKDSAEKYPRSRGFFFICFPNAPVISQQEVVLTFIIADCLAYKKSSITKPEDPMRRNLQMTRISA